MKTLGIGAEISAMIAESEAFDYLDAPILRLGGAEAPIPYNPVLEKAAVPQDRAHRRRRARPAAQSDLADADRGHPAQGRYGHGRPAQISRWHGR